MRWFGVLLAVVVVAWSAGTQEQVITPPPFTLLDPTLTVLPSYNDAWANWKNAGLQSVGGIPNRTTQCGATVTPTGVTNPPQATDDATTINAAIAACPQDQVVQLSSGTFVISSSEQILLGNRSVLRGSGTCNNANTPYCATVITVYDGMLPWDGGQCGFGPFAAGASWTTSNSTITMSVSNPGYVTAGLPVFDLAIGAQIGTVSNWTSTTLTLTGNASKASLGSSDNLGFQQNCGIEGFIAVQPSAASNQFDFGWSGGCSVIGSAVGCGTDLDADAAKGQTTIQVHSTTGFSVGQWVLIDEASGALYLTDLGMAGAIYGNVWGSPDLFSTSGSPATGRVQWSKWVVASNGDMAAGAYPYNNPGTMEALNDRATSEIHLITAVASNTNCPGVNCTITFDDPLMMAYRASGMTTFTGAISGTTLTTTGDSCTTSVAQIVDDANHVILDGTYITAKNSCSAGAGNYTVSRSQTVTSRTMIGGAHQAHIYFSTHQGGGAMPFLQFAGVENLTIQRAPNGSVNFVFCGYCWAKNVESVAWGAGSFNFTDSARVQIERSFSNNCYNSTNDGAEYPIGMQKSSTEIYIVNNIVVGCGKGMVGKSGGGNVVAYNYVDKTMYDSFSGIGNWFVDMSVNGSHWAGTHHYLFEGNWGNNLDNDNTHGNAVYHTYFRNWGTALRTAFTDPSKNSPNTVDDFNGTGYDCFTNGPAGPCNSVTPAYLRAVGPMNHVYWMAYVGNVLGTSQTTVANGWSYFGNTNAANLIWMSGWNNDSNHPTVTDPNLDGTNTPQFLFKHGNYDYVHGSIFDWNGSFSRALPTSFYLSARPSFFAPGASCTYPWPWVTPETGTQIRNNSCSNSGLPAKARYDAGTPFVQP